MSSELIVVDASALLAFLKQEPGSQQMETYLGNLLICSLNFAEVVFRLSHYLPINQIEPLLVELVEVIPLDTALALQIAQLKLQTKQLGLSYGDCACLALAQSRDLSVLTADKVWARLDSSFKIIQIR